jgi:hypothetical protein
LAAAIVPARVLNHLHNPLEHQVAQVGEPGPASRTVDELRTAAAAHQVAASALLDRWPHVLQAHGALYHRENVAVQAGGIRHHGLIAQAGSLGRRLRPSRRLLRAHWRCRSYKNIYL